MNLFLLHQKMTAHLFPAYSSQDERFLSLALCGEVGELIELLEGDFEVHEARDETADIRIYLELIAKCFDIEGDKLPAKAIDTPLTEVQLLLGLAARSGKLANLIKKRWRDGTDLSDECRILIIAIRSYVEAIAYRLGIEGEKLDEVVVAKLAKVAEKHKDRIGG